VPLAFLAEYMSAYVAPSGVHIGDGDAAGDTEVLHSRPAGGDAVAHCVPGWLQPITQVVPPWQNPV
jgi:hypothetical protein